MSSRGKIYAMITIFFGCAAVGLSIYVLSTCEFYEATWTNADSTRPSSATPGIFLCKYYDGKMGTFEGPTGGWDMMALVGGFMGAALGLMATMMVGGSYWKCPCKVKNTGVASCIFMMAVICQGLTLLVLVSPACNEDYSGECKLSTNAWLSVASAGTFFIASSFAREVAGGNTLPK